MTTQERENGFLRTPQEFSRAPIYKTLSAPIDVQIEITTACNNNCIHCYNFWRGENPTKNFLEAILNEEKFSQIIEELARNRVFWVTFTGGEPLLFKKLVLAGIKLANEKGMSTSVNTNLTTITSEDANRLKENGVITILTSLLSFDEKTHDSITQRRGSFKRTVRGIKACLDADLDVWVNMVVLPQNQDYIIETGKFVKELGAKGFSATKAVPCLSCSDFSSMEISRDDFKRSLEDLLRLEKEQNLEIDALTAYPLCALQDAERFERFARRHCVAGITTCTIGSSGEVRPCSHADESYGNIFSEPLSEIWKKMGEWRDGSLLPKKCLEECAYFQSCGGGCRVEAKYRGDICGMDPLATGPEEVISLPSFEEILPPRDFLERKLEISPYIQVREEEFGGIVARRGGLPLFLNKDAYEILRKLKAQISSFSLREVMSELNLSENSLGFFHVLFSKRIIKERHES